MEEGNFIILQEFIIGGSDFEPTEARLDKASDWFADIMMIDGTDLMKASIGHGSPYAYFEMTSGNVMFNFVDDITIYYNSDDHVGLTTTRGNNYMDYLLQQVQFGRESILGQTKFQFLYLLTFFHCWVT